MDTSTVVAAATDTLGRRIARRRHRSIQEKQAIVAESLKPGASVAEIARRYGVNANLVFVWRRLHQQGLLETHTRRMSGRKLIPVKILSDNPSASASGASLRVELPGGMQLHIGSGVDVTLLERVIELLRR